MASLMSMPMEILLLISTNLSTPDLGSFRLTCKHVERRLFDSFAKEFFSKRQFMLTLPSLQALVDISEHPTLAKRLIHVIIGLEQYRDVDVNFTNTDAYEKYLQGYADQSTILSTGTARDFLTAAFKNLPNLETVEIRDFNSPGRYRDGNAVWNSYGAPTVFAETGVQLRSGELGGTSDIVKLRYESRVFSALLSALGKATRTPSSVEINLRSRGCGLEDFAFNVPSFGFPEVQPVLHGMKTLLLTLDPAAKRYAFSQELKYPSCSQTFLRRFLAHTNNLTHLRLNFKPYLEHENARFLEWLAQPLDGPSVTGPPPVAFPCLERLEFGHLREYPDRLLGVITKFAATLKGLSLWRIGARPNPVALAERQDLWATFFTSLAEVPGLELNNILVGQLTHLTSLHTYSRVDFHSPGDASQKVDKNTKGEAVLQYTGKEATTFIRGLVERVQVEWPEEDDSDVSMLDESEDEEEE